MVLGEVKEDNILPEPAIPVVHCHIDEEWEKEEKAHSECSFVLISNHVLFAREGRLSEADLEVHQVRLVFLRHNELEISLGVVPASSTALILDLTLNQHSIDVYFLNDRYGYRFVVTHVG